MPKLESQYRTELSKRIQRRWPDSVIVPTDPSRQQGILDILILIGRRWAMLELKRRANSSRRPNQPYFVEKFNDMSYAAFICPENEDEVLDELQATLGI